MLKGKLPAIIGGTMSVVVAATTALTLALSGSRNTMSLNALSDNDAVAFGVTGLLDSAKSGVNTVTEVIDTISENKAALSMGLQINEMADLKESSGLGANLNINFDTESGQYSLDANAVYGTIELFNSILYMDEKELVASVPTFFNGIITLSYDNLEEDLQNSYIGSLLVEEGFDFEQFKEELAVVLDNAASLPEFKYDFDYEDFVDGICDTMNDAYLAATKNMDVTDNGMQPLNGGKYQCYTASISVADLSYILRDAIVYILESEDFQNYLDYLMEYMNTVYGSYDSEYGNDVLGGSMYDMDMSYSSQFAAMAPMINSYWGMIVSELEAVLGKDIQFTIYLSETVETAGFELYMSIYDDGILNYDKTAAMSADAAFIFKADYTGGKEIGDYSYVTFEVVESGRIDGKFEYSYKMEESGDFALDLSMIEGESALFSVHLDGKYTEKDSFFTLKVDSFKFVDNDGETLFDIAFHLSFEPISGVIRPTGSPEHDIWDMDEEQFKALADEIENNLKKIEDSLGNAFN